MGKTIVKTKDVLDKAGIDDIEWAEIIDEWLTHKRENRQSYKSVNSASIMVKRLVNNLSDGDPVVGREIVERSIMNNWSGLFPLKPWELQKIKDEEKKEHAKPEQDAREGYF